MNPIVLIFIRTAIAVSVVLLGFQLYVRDARSSYPVVSDMVFGMDLQQSQEEMAIVYEKARAIAWCEGFYKKGTRAQRNHNPGNIKGPLPRDDGGHTVFPSVIEGWNALHYLLITKYKDMTPSEMFAKGYAESNLWPICVNSRLLK